MCLNVCNISVELIRLLVNPKTDDLHSDSLQSVPNGPHSLMTGPVPLKIIGQSLLNTIPGIPQFSGTEREKDYCSV